MRWPWRKREPDVQPWPGPPAPLPGGAPRNGDAWHDLLPSEALTEHTALLPVVTPAARLRGEGGGWR
ncbi:MAG: hypothetical protein ACRDT2_03390 [Natronosporangium sp.]